MNQLSFLGRTETIKAISLWQPWASLVALGVKRFETRSWFTPYRGPLVIHAAKHLEKGDCRRPEITDALMAGGIDKFSKIPLGAYLCVVNLVDCYRTEQVLLRGLIQEPERAFGDYSPNRYAWQLENVRTFEPIPARGYQQLWEPLKGLGPESDIYKAVTDALQHRP